MMAQSSAESDVAKRLLDRVKTHDRMTCGSDQALGYYSSWDAKLMREAADEIERLRHDLDRHMQIAVDVLNDAQPGQLPKSLPLEGFASQPSPAATVGMDWKLSDETKQQIDEIDRNIREAPANIASHSRLSAGNDDLAIIEEFVRRNVGGQPALDAIARLRTVPQAAREIDRDAVAAIVLKAMQAKVDPDAYGASYAIKMNADRAVIAADSILALTRPKG